MTKQMIFLEEEPAEGAATFDPDGGSGLEDPNDCLDDRNDRNDGDPNDFRIDAHTREIARMGIAAARQALAEAVKRAAARDQKLAA